MRNLRATSPQVQAAKVVSERHPLARNSMVFGEESGRTDVQNLSSTDQISFSIRDGTGMGRATKSTDEIFAAQSQATLSDGKSKVEARNAKNVKTEVVKSEAKVQTATGSSETPSGRKTGIKLPSKRSPKGKRTSDRTEGSKKKSRQNDNPPADDPDESLDSYDSRLDDNASSDSDSSTFGDITSSVPVTLTMQLETTVFSFNPFVNANSLDDFNEKASLSDRIRWLEKFQSMTISGGWSDKTPKLEYCKARTTDSEKNYTIAQRKSETPREFFYRLNKTAAKAGIDIHSTSKLRDQHVKTFIRKLIDKQLRATLQGQRIRSMTDLEFILKHHDKTWHKETDVYPSRVRDFRADNHHMRRHHPKQYGKPYVATHSEDKSEDVDDERDSNSEEEPPTKSDLSVPKANQSESFPKQKDAGSLK
ncbi:LOW QUALITY PROTEIN: hypothetical protein PHMEG_00028107 [Phytophthora megakarya]|uniref:Eukaryotic/viral aspartic protease n=1 Tax=Phytophthora megakarya TaxID=4795 RepID=A0A225V6R8_9STRA|nr:LOW QUALITY PROTEIN: hypothetical protein PHMEG_00028107 [Phytophthora megakarya]